ncbi:MULTISPECIES: hypothetical protein [unclassified Paenibacillus]|uniref:hypothetical protein n=1 Tax=Paenibacillus TaxID=44249 RepID=UPI001162984C|nr:MULTISPECIES: hypothetical protein [unclassified Paenibacillus]AWP26227.1 hypothetical protein B9D94_06235 [Paenibacillus sp. Cedars]MDH6670318.1 hypothetical protein [Paenibacillus sp. LBL]
MSELRGRGAYDGFNIMAPLRLRRTLAVYGACCTASPAALVFAGIVFGADGKETSQIDLAENPT